MWHVPIVELPTRGVQSSGRVVLVSTWVFHTSAEIHHLLIRSLGGPSRDHLPAVRPHLMSMSHTLHSINSSSNSIVITNNNTHNNNSMNNNNNMNKENLYLQLILREMCILLHINITTTRITSQHLMQN